MKNLYRWRFIHRHEKWKIFEIILIGFLCQIVLQFDENLRGRSSIRPYFPQVFGKRPSFGEQKFSKNKSIWGFVQNSWQFVERLRVGVQSVPTFLEYTESNEEETHFAKFHLNIFCWCFVSFKVFRLFPLAKKKTQKQNSLVLLSFLAG